MNLLTTVTVVIVGSIAGLWAWAIFWEVRRVHRIQYWPTSPGQVLDSWVTDKNSSPGYNVRVEYQYDVGGNRYVGSAIAMEAGVDDKDQAETECGAYLLGPELRISYNPRRPGESKIIDLQPPLDVKQIVYGIVWIVLCAFFAYVAITGGVEWGSPGAWESW